MKNKAVFFLLLANSLMFASDSDIFKAKQNERIKDVNIELPSNSTSNYKIDDIQSKRKSSEDINISLNKDKADLTDVKSFISSDIFSRELDRTKKSIINDENMQYKKLTETLKQYDNEVNKKLNVSSNQKNGKRFLKGDVITIFISSSMDKELIKNYFKAFKNVNQDVEFVLNGLLPNTGTKIMPTVNYIRDLLKDEYSYSVVIDPRRFEEYSIDRVPTVLYKNEQDVYLYTGAVAPKEALKEIYYKNTTENKSLKNLIDNI